MSVSRPAGGDWLAQQVDFFQESDGTVHLPSVPIKPQEKHTTCHHPEMLCEVVDSVVSPRNGSHRCFQPRPFPGHPG